MKWVNGMKKLNIQIKAGSWNIVASEANASDKTAYFWSIHHYVYNGVAHGVQRQVCDAVMDEISDEES